MKELKTFKKLHDYLSKNPTATVEHFFLSKVGLCFFLDRIPNKGLKTKFNSYACDYTRLSSVYASPYVDTPFTCKKRQRLYVGKTRLILLLLIALCEGEKF